MAYTEQKFWLVWNPAGGNPHHRHPNHELAVAEAEKLAKKQPGEIFYVLAAEKMTMQPLSTITHTLF